MAICTHLQAQDVQAIARDYGLEVTHFAPLEGGANNSNYHLDRLNPQMADKHRPMACLTRAIDRLPSARFLQVV